LFKIQNNIALNGGFIQLGENEKEAGEKTIFAPLPAGKTGQVGAGGEEDDTEQADLPERGLDVF